MNKTTLAAIGMSAFLSSVVWADKPETTTAKVTTPAPAMKTVKSAGKADKASTPDKASKGTTPAKMTCEEFVMLEDVARPKLVYWAEGYNRKGKPEEATFDIEATDRLVPVLVEICKQAPKESFWKKAKAEFKKIF